MSKTVKKQSTPREEKRKVFSVIITDSESPGFRMVFETPRQNDEQTKRAIKIAMDKRLRTIFHTDEAVSM